MLKLELHITGPALENLRVLGPLLTSQLLVVLQQNMQLSLEHSIDLQNPTSREIAILVGSEPRTRQNSRKSRGLEALGVGRVLKDGLWRKEGGIAV